MILRPIAGLLTLALLAGCGSNGLLRRGAPDELLTARQAPLVVPPDYNLMPPAPGAPRPLAPDARTEALQTLFPEAQPPKSAAETLLLQQSGGDRRDATARATVGDPATVVVNKGAFTRTLVDAPPLAGDPAVATVRVGG